MFVNWFHVVSRPTVFSYQVFRSMLTEIKVHQQGQFQREFSFLILNFFSDGSLFSRIERVGLPTLE